MRETLNGGCSGPATPPPGGAAALTVFTADCPVDLHRIYSGERLLTRVHAGRSLALPLVQLLPPGPVPVELHVDPRPFEAPLHLRAALAGPVAALRAHPDRHDGTLTSLRSLRPGTTGTFEGVVSPVSYFCTRALESLLDAPPHLRRADQPACGRLPRIEDSLLACDIGVVVLLETADGFRIAQRRSTHLDWRPGHLSVSASGSLEPGRDFSSARVGLDGLLAGARRELAEELGVGGALDPHRDTLEVRSLGIWRELQRGGKPELYTVAHTPLTAAEVRRLHSGAPDSAESLDLVALDARGCAEVLDRVTHRGGQLGGAGPGDVPIDLALVAALLLAQRPTG